METTRTKIELINGLKSIGFQEEFWITVGVNNKSQAVEVINAINKTGYHEVETNDIGIIVEVSVKVVLSNATPMRNTILDVVNSKDFNKIK